MLFKFEYIAEKSGKELKQFDLSEDYGQIAVSCMCFHIIQRMT